MSSNGFYMKKKLTVIRAPLLGLSAVLEKRRHAFVFRTNMSECKYHTDQQMIAMKFNLVRGCY